MTSENLEKIHTISQYLFLLGQLYGEINSPGQCAALSTVLADLSEQLEQTIQ
jgi:hypothetical protein